MSDTAVLLLSLVAALLPAIIYVVIIYWFDRYEKEPWWLLTAVFFWGAVPSIFVALLFNTVFSIPFYLVAGEATSDALAAILIAPPIEESVKGMALLALLLFWRHEIDSPLDGIIYGAMIGLGFAMVENLFYFLTVFAESGVEAWGINIFLRTVIFGLNHALFTSMTGLGIAVARMSTGGVLRFAAPVLGWMTAVFLHFLHNFSVSFGNALCFLALLFDWGGVLLTLGIIVWVLLQERQWLKTYLAEEVAAGTLTQKQYETVCSGRKRTAYRYGRLLAEGFRSYRRANAFHHRCSELAYKKHHFTLFRDEKSREMIAELRGEVTQLSRQLA